MLRLINAEDTEKYFTILSLIKYNKHHFKNYRQNVKYYLFINKHVTL